MSVDPLLERLPECQNFNKNHVSDSFVAFMKETRKEDVGGGSVKRRRKKVAVPGKNVFDQDLNNVDDTSALATSTPKQKTKKRNKPLASAPKRCGRSPGSRTAESTKSNQEDSPDEIDTLSPASVLADDMPGPLSGILSNSPPPRHVTVSSPLHDENETFPLYAHRRKNTSSKCRAVRYCNVLLY